MCRPHSRSELTDESRDRRREDAPLEALTAGAVTLFVLSVAFGALALGNSWFWIAFPIGFGGLLPLSLGYVRRYESNRNRNDTRDRTRADSSDPALSVLRDRYARGEIDEREFESRVERLLETESIGESRAYLRQRGSPNDGSTP